MLRSSTKILLIKAYSLDISNKVLFKKFQDRWLEIISDLCADGMACKECEKQFEDIIGLKTHLENHSRESLASFKMCGTKFSRFFNIMEAKET